MTKKPVTLGDKLATFEPAGPQRSLRTSIQDMVSSLLNFSLVTGVFVVVLWIRSGQVGLSGDAAWIIAAVMAGVWLLITLFCWQRQNCPLHSLYKGSAQRRHPLLANDLHGFMSDLRLDAKTAIIDGSNIYHFGREYGLDARPLELITKQLRRDGFRIVCFFDANIFYTLIERGILPSQQSHSSTRLGALFGLNRDEIYVVPGGVQADQYILESLKYLPVSFAITNDRFRDYASEYPSVMKDNAWRKGVVWVDGEIKVHQLKFQKPLLLPAETTR